MRARTHNADWLDTASTTIDLRKKLPTDRVDTIRARADWLTPQERTLVLAVVDDGYSASDIARLNKDDPRSVRRRLKRALTRLDDPSFLFVIRNSRAWSPTRRRVAHAVFCAGKSIRVAAQDLGLSVHQVRRHRDSVLSLINTRAPDRSWR